MYILCLVWSFNPESWPMYRLIRYWGYLELFLLFLFVVDLLWSCDGLFNLMDCIESRVVKVVGLTKSCMCVCLCLCLCFWVSAHLGLLGPPGWACDWGDMTFWHAQLECGLARGFLSWCKLGVCYNLTRHTPQQKINK